MKNNQLNELIIKELEAQKANEIVCLNVHKLTDVTDYMIIASGTSKRHVHAIGKNLVDQLKLNDIRPIGIEDEPNSTWILIDYGDVVVHIMQPETREFYDLEKLWSITSNKRKKT